MPKSNIRTWRDTPRECFYRFNHAPCARVFVPVSRVQRDCPAETRTFRRILRYNRRVTLAAVVCFNVYNKVPEYLIRFDQFKIDCIKNKQTNIATKKNPISFFLV